MRVAAWWMLAVVLSGCAGGAADKDGEGTEGSEPGETEGTETSASATVGTEGGTVETATVEVAIPAGALSAATEITVGPPEGTVAAVPEGSTATGDAVAFLPHGTTFASPVTITLTHDGTADTVLRLDDEADTTWEPVADVTLGDGTITFESSTFSIYLAVSRCNDYCNHVSTECSTTMGSCQSACTAVAPTGPVTGSCATAQQALMTCYTGTTASGFDCSTSLPAAGTCATERAAVLSACGGVSSTTGACPCFDAADLSKAYGEAAAAGGVYANDGSDWGVCTWTGTGPTDPASLNSIWFESKNGTTNDVLFQTVFSSGPSPDIAGSLICGIWSEGNPMGSFTQTFQDGISTTQEADCEKLLTSYQSYMGWTCTEMN